MSLNPRSKKFSPADEAAMEAAERHWAKSEALMHGAAKMILTGTEANMWGAAISCDVAIQLLEEAKAERQAGMGQKAKVQSIGRPRRNRA